MESALWMIIIFLIFFGLPSLFLAGCYNLLSPLIKVLVKRLEPKSDDVLKIKDFNDLIAKLNLLEQEIQEHKHKLILLEDSNNFYHNLLEAEMKAAKSNTN